MRELQQIHAQINNQPNDLQHKLSHWLVKNYQWIFAEDLNIKAMAAGMLAKSVMDVGWAMLLAKVAYKAESAGRLFKQVNPNGTTQNCSGCGNRVYKGLSQRWYACPFCGLELDRDENAALNILRLGLSLLDSTWPVAACVSNEAVCF